MTRSVTIRFIERASLRHPQPLVWFDRPVRNASCACVIGLSDLALFLTASDLRPLDAYTQWLEVGSHPPGLDLSTLHDAPARLDYGT